MFIFSDKRARLGRVLRVNAFAVNVRAKGDVAELREHRGAALFVIGQAEPLMEDEDAGAFAGNGIVVGKKPFERRVALFVVIFIRSLLQQNLNNKTVKIRI